MNLNKIKITELFIIFASQINIMDYNNLIYTIQNTHDVLQTSVAKSINRGLTIRNWLIGYYIFEFQQNGKDRAKYGEKLLSEISKSSKINGLSITNLKLFRQFYNTYPSISKALTETLENLPIGQSLTDQFKLPIGQTVSDQFKSPINQPVSDELKVKIGISPLRIISKLSFSHLVELIKIEDDLKRAFYELECTNGVWSVRELKRQIESLYFERSGISKDKEKLSQYVNDKSVKLKPNHIINSPFSIEFLGLNDRAIVTESDLEKALIQNLQHFLLEMGNGFCFEARQKRIIVDDEYYFVDLVFYNRLLKCHVIIELKTEKFTHNHASQLNFYLNYFEQEVMQKGDNPPVGILLCTEKGETTVKYATTGLSEQIFVQKYMLNLPSKKELKNYIDKH